MRLGSLCSGIGGLELGLEWALGCETIWQVELEPQLRAVLAAHWPNAKRFDDVTQVGSRNLEPVDLICFGSPCQDVSSAGKRLGLSGPKSRLFYECARVVGELGPEWVVVENVASGASRWVDAVRQELEHQGYASLPVMVGAADCGAPHRRDRVFIVAHAERAKLRQQSGGAAGRTGKIRHSLQSLASAHAHSESGELSAPSRSRLPDSHRGGEHGGVANVDGEFGDAGNSEAREECAGRTESSGGLAPDALRTRREGSGPGAHTSRERPPAGSWRTPVPDILRMVHGVSARLDRARDRIAALGNSCTPPQAEVVGNVIRILIEAEGLKRA